MKRHYYYVLDAGKQSVGQRKSKSLYKALCHILAKNRAIDTPPHPQDQGCFEKSPSGTVPEEEEAQGSPVTPFPTQGLWLFQSKCSHMPMHHTSTPLPKQCSSHYANKTHRAHGQSSQHFPDDSGPACGCCTTKVRFALALCDCDGDSGPRGNAEPLGKREGVERRWGKEGSAGMLMPPQATLLL